MIHKSLSAGIRTLVRSWRSVLVLYGAQFIFAALAVSPLKIILDTYLVPSGMAESFRNGFSLPTFIELATVRSAAFVVLFRIWFLLILVFEFFAIIFDGGIISVIDQGDRRQALRSVFSGGFRYFWRFFRLGLLFIAAMGLLLTVCVLLFIPIGKLIDHAATHVEIWLFLSLLGTIGVFLFIMIRTIFDLAKVLIVMRDSSSVLKTFSLAVKTYFSNFGTTAGLSLILFVFTLIVIVAELAVNSSLNESAMLLVFLLFFIEQAFLLTRVSGRVLFFSTYHALLASLVTVEAQTPEPAPEPVAAPTLAASGPSGQA